MTRHFKNDVLVVGDGAEEEQASKEEVLAFKRIKSLSDLKTLRGQFLSEFDSLFTKPTPKS
jgi:hypothetical protein